MKKITKKLRYISNRVRFLADCGFILFLVLILREAISVYKYHTSPKALLFMTVMIIFLTILYIFWIYRPFREAEKMQNQLLDGYMVYERWGKSNPTGVMLTPASQREWEKMVDIMTSTRISNLNKRQAQYLALQNQINPHFLYNTLDGIRSEALIAGVDHVAEMTEALANYFRYTVSKVENLVTVEEELDNCQIYFKIQQYRFGDRISLSIDCDEENREEILRCRIPKLTLQPVLENSIIHGTEPKLGKGKQTIHLMLTGSRVIIRVSDDGVGMDEKTLAKLNDKLERSSDQFSAENKEQKGGIALYNVNHRIHLIFGAEYGLHIFSMKNIGTDVEISIPIVHDEREIKNQGALS
ncbi:MAG: sensor histidine kinase [Coprococcus sp.]